MKNITINKVMSNDVQSKIFNAFNSFFIKYSKYNYQISSNPIKEVIDIYHYHRPNLETKLLPNSIVTVHHDLEDIDPWLIKDKFLNRYKEASHIVCLNTIQQDILKQHGILNTTVIPHGYKDDIFKPKPLKLYDKKEKITLGIISKRYERRVKGEAYLLEMIKRLSNKNFRFILVGENRTQDALLLDSFGFEVEVFEHLPYSLYPCVYQKMDFLFMISLFEGGPANLPEALATAVPVIATKVGMVEDMIQDKQNGLLLTGNYNKDADMINSLLENNGELFNTLQMNLQKKQEILTWKEVVRSYEKIYKKVKGV